jgi:hypothetical protein
VSSGPNCSVTNLIGARGGFRRSVAKGGFNSDGFCEQWLRSNRMLSAMEVWLIEYFGDTEKDD